MKKLFAVIMEVEQTELNEAAKLYEQEHGTQCPHDSAALARDLQAFAYDDGAMHGHFQVYPLSSINALKVDGNPYDAAPDMLAALQAADCPNWVHNAGITNSIEDLRAIALWYADWNNSVRLPAIAKAAGGTAPAPDLITADTATCDRCQGNGEIVTDWDRYKHPHDGDVGDEAVAECPNCNGTGCTAPAPAVTVAECMEVLKIGRRWADAYAFSLERGNNATDAKAVANDVATIDALIAKAEGRAQ